MSWRVAAGLSVLLLSAGAHPSLAEIYLGNTGGGGRVTVHANDAAGNAAPVRVIQGLEEDEEEGLFDPTGLDSPRQIFADVLHNELFVANRSGNSITVYPLGASGTPFPLRTIEGAATQLDQPQGVVVDLVHDELFVSNFVSGPSGSITVYPRTANGNVAPLRQIIGPAALLQGVSRLAFDSSRNELVVACQGANPGAPGIRFFSRTANGNVAPLRNLTGEATDFEDPIMAVLDIAHDQIVVLDRQEAISTFPRNANGNVAPLRRIAGPATQLDEDISLGLLGTSEIVVAHEGNAGSKNDDAILVFARDASGNVAPRRSINGPNTLFEGVSGIDVVSPRLGLRNNRFGVQAVFHTLNGAVGDGKPVALTSDTGYLWFFQDTNVEIVVKVLNGCGINSRFWVFAGGLTDVNVDLIVTDYASGQVKIYTNPQKTPFQPIQDTSAFATCFVGSPALAPGAQQAELSDAGTAAEMNARLLERDVEGRDVAGPALLLNNNRFDVRIDWTDRHGSAGVGHPVAVTGDTGYFWFFQEENVEVVVKVLNACGINTRYWVFAGGLTDVNVRMTVKDTANPQNSKVYINPQRTPFQPIQDTSAFATCP